MHFIRYLKMPFHFDAARLQADLDRFDTEPWILHGNRFIYRGEWSGLSLRNGSGDPADLAADSLRGSGFVKTPLLDRCDYISEVMGAFACPLGSVRFLKVAAGAEIDEHVDGGLCYEVGEVRFHIPVVTHAALDFRLNGERLVMQPGECWYINANMPHSLANRGTIDRVHLVIDAGVNDWLRGYFGGAESVGIGGV
ncbi:MAG: hypothetical protein ETSY2_09355 [Candidatus Entotheonella gemina]|uniref:Aspartyl/asparaginy/proline hydroxylase domain-containing protein n=1 Tax=Candidatus Entotheonella gemina TaxID=1429439 RepID=W4MC41_9BACT|nr:MAG: hypothetical protein ETSY2_09355 [Candidatus Entotheonella gemina]